MDRITIDAGIGTITAKTDGNLLLQQVLDAFKEKMEHTTPQKMIKLLTSISESDESSKDEIGDLKDEIRDKNKEISKLEEQVEELEQSIESDEGLTEIDMGYGKIWYKTDNLKLEMYMEQLTEKLQLQGV